MTIPDLSGLITKEDVNHINMGNRQIDYTSWAKITQLIKQNAPGWEFNLRQSESSNFVWSAPNGTGFFVCYFTSPEKEATADFPYPIMDHRNNPVKFSEISSRVLTDNHRRAFCACACFTFALAHEMWSQEEVRDTALKNAVTDTQPLQTKEKKQAPLTPAREPDIHKGFGKRLDPSEKGTFIALIKTFNKEYPSKADWLLNTFHQKVFPGTKPVLEKYWSTNLLFHNQAELVAKLIDEMTQELKEIPF
jgi:hypothetical protein